MLKCPIFFVPPFTDADQCLRPFCVCVCVCICVQNNENEFCNVEREREKISWQKL